MKHLCSRQCVVVTLVLYTVHTTHSCSVGYFGPGCTYVCNCENSGDCSEDGTCGTGRCKAGFFGSMCQLYDSFSRWIVSSSVDEKLYDNDVTTCVTVSSMNPKFKERMTFLWMRLIFSAEVDALVATDGIEISMKVMRFYPKCNTHIRAEKNQADVDCGADTVFGSIDEIKLDFKTSQSVCSVHISLGVNVASRAEVIASSEDPNYPASLAVDGNDKTCYQSPGKSEPQYMIIVLTSYHSRVFMAHITKSDVSKHW